ncbi:PleD family two-component system response regulator [Elusimicrobiota bacterium]
MPKKILIADDDPEIVTMLASRLKANNYEVSAAYDAMQTIVKAHKENPDLIILDVRMPAGGGVRVFENLRKSINTALTPIIFTSAYSSEEVEKIVMDSGALDFIPKPFIPEEVILKIKRILGEEDRKIKEERVG